MGRSERGQNLVEVAIIIPLLLLLLVGIADLGRAFYSLNIVTNAAREGARYGSRFSFDEAGIMNAALSYLDISGATSGTNPQLNNCQVWRPVIEADLRGRAIRVTVQCDYGTIFPLINDFTLARDASMKIEGPAP